MPTAATTYLDRVLPALDAAGGRVAALLTAAPDPALPVPATPGWSVRDLAAHLATVVVRYADGPEGRGTWTPTPVELAGLNRDQLRALDGAGVGDLALGLLLGELLVHGHDLAGALRQPWPIDPDHAALVVAGLDPILPGWVRPERVAGLTAASEIRLRGQDRHVWAFRDGRLQVNPPDPTRIDVHLSGDPAALLLVFYARESPWRHLATGRILAWGRRPRLALTLTRRFHRP